MQRAICMAAVAVFATGSCFDMASGATIQVEQPAFTSPSIIDFDSLSGPLVLDTEFLSLGVDFLQIGDSFTPGSPSSVNLDSEPLFGSFPAHTSSNLVFGGSQVLEFTTPKTRVGAFVYKFNGQQYLHAFDASQTLLLTVPVDSGSTDDANFDFVGIESTDGIKYITISDDNLGGGAGWSSGGATTFWDTLYFEPAAVAVVPEPTTLVLLMLGIPGLVVGVRRRKRT